MSIFLKKRLFPIADKAVSPLLIDLSGIFVRRVPSGYFGFTKGLLGSLTTIGRTCRHWSYLQKRLHFMDA